MTLKTDLQRLGLKQNQFAKLLDVSPRTVSLWSTGETAIPGPVRAYLRVLHRLTPEELEIEMQSIELEVPRLKEGCCRFDYSSGSAIGTGMFALRENEVIGSDVGGAAYGGSVSYNPITQLFSLDIQMQAPVGGTLVTGLSADRFPQLLKVAVEIQKPQPTAKTIVDVAGNKVEIACTYLGPFAV